MMILCPQDQDAEDQVGDHWLSSLGPCILIARLRGLRRRSLVLRLPHTELPVLLDGPSVHQDRNGRELCGFPLDFVHLALLMSREAHLYLLLQGRILEAQVRLRLFGGSLN